MITKITNHYARSLDVLVSQFKDKPNIQALIHAFCDQMQECEDVNWQLLTERWLDVAVGFQLDVLGDLVGMRRRIDPTWSDDFYRRMIGIKFRVNASQGEGETMIYILLHSTDSDHVLWDEYPRATATASFDGSVENIHIIAGLMQDAKDGGVRLVLIHYEGDDAFTFDLGDGLGWGDALDPAIGGLFAGIVGV